MSGYGSVVEQLLDMQEVSASVLDISGDGKTSTCALCQSKWTMLTLKDQYQYKADLLFLFQF